MPAPQPVANAVKVQLKWTAAGAPDIHVGFYFSYSGGPPVVNDCLLFCGDVISAATPLAGHWTSDVSLNSVKVTDLSSAVGAVAEQATNLVGSRTPGGIDNAMCVVAHYAIARRYRGGKPRGYWPFGDSGELASRVAWSASFVASCQTDLTAFFNGLAGKTHGSTNFGNHINVSFYEGFTNSPPDPVTNRVRAIPTPRVPPLKDVITSVTCSTRPGTQRRRI